MTRWSLTATALLVAVLAEVFVSAGLATEAEPYPADMQVISSDATARYVPLGLGKAFVIDLAGDIKDVLVGSPTVVSAVVRTKHRAYIIGAGIGQTNVYFFDAAGQQIGALDVAVSGDPRPLDVLGDSVVVSNFITVYPGLKPPYPISCTPAGCRPPPQTLEAAPTSIIETRAR
jgi:Flp pilus assembly secretin CpaC